MRSLRISGCAMSGKQSKKESKDPANLKDFFVSAVALKHINVSDTKLTADNLKLVVLRLGGAFFTILSTFI